MDSPKILAIKDFLLYSLHQGNMHDKMDGGLLLREFAQSPALIMKEPHCVCSTSLACMTV